MALIASAYAADDRMASPDTSSFHLPEVGEQNLPAGVRRARVLAWIREKVPECPVSSASVVADKFLEEMQTRHTEIFEHLDRGDFTGRDFESSLLGQIGAQMNESSQADLREKIAVRRVQAWLAAENGEGTPASQDAAGLFAKMRSLSPAQFRRLVEGRMDDDDLAVLVRRAREVGVEHSQVVAAPVAKSQDADEIVAEFARRNQTGAALSRLQAYAVEARLTTSGGQVQQLLLYRMRPDRFRLVIMVGGATRYIVAADNNRFWQQSAGQPARVAVGRDLGGQRNLAEFIDPMFTREGYDFALLAESGADRANHYRIGVSRPDGSHYVAWIDRDTYRQTGREEDDATMSRYSDFREVAGVTFAFREEITDHEGRKGVLEITRITPNPGLVQDFFRPALEGGLDYFLVEQMALRSVGATGSPAALR